MTTDQHDSAQRPPSSRRPMRMLVALAVLLAVVGSAAFVSAHRGGRASRPFTEPIPTSARLDPNSPEMIRRLVAGARHGFRISSKAYTTPLYYAGPRTGRKTVALTAPWAPARRLSGVPIPADAQPDPAGDHHLTIVDPRTGCEYDLWRAQKKADGSWSAAWANATDGGGGVYRGGWAATAAGFTNLAGKIRPEELAAGEIRHALVFAFPYTKAGGPVLPATSSDGKSTVSGAIPEGARLQLDPALDLNALGLTDWQKVIAHALQVYGMYLGDTGGTVGLSAINARSFAGTPYPWGDVDYAYLPSALLQHMRVLQLPRQHRPHSELIRTHCAQLR